MALLILEDDPARPDVTGLLGAHIALMRGQSAPESCHVLDVSELRTPAITFWSVREDGRLLGCGALKALHDDGDGEIKSMHTAAAERGRGVAARLVDHILAEARRRGYSRLYLETGAQPAFAAARALYARFGFAPCPAFTGYRDDPASVFMTLDLAAGGVSPPGAT